MSLSQTYTNLRTTKPLAGGGVCVCAGRVWGNLKTIHSVNLIDGSPTHLAENWEHKA